MLGDRDYMRSERVYGRASRWKTATAAILIFNAAVFLIEALAPRLFPTDYLSLSWLGLRHGYLWQLFTFQFLHAGLLHLVLNSIGIYFFGFAVEEALGTKRFVWLYLASGVIGGLVHVAGSLVLPSRFGVMVHEGLHLYTPVVGASAGVFGLITAYALMFPHRELTVLLFFVIPVTVSARVLLGVSLGISLLGILIDNGRVAHGAHAGGILGGWLMLRWLTRPKPVPTRAAGRTAPEPEVESETEFFSEAVDPILEKISRHGIQSLTAHERKVLDTARKRMERR
ncbi:MAG TPA: rhomboid family intramembrane serine protease [Verrucomicrobiota bacterium]|nr:rhomboid family intramembrane serine protease [Verrucomicrobiota bacterium]HNT14501.1 rhomboid family intramembrane serine protease [Verrucomicrobiota bacterium]